MSEAFVLEGKILLDAQKVINDLERVDNKAEQTGSAFDKISSKASSFSKSLDKWVTRGLIAGGAALVGFGVKAVDTASDLQEVQNVVDTTFGNNADKINEWSKAAAESFGLSELQAKQYTGTLGAMLKSMGMTENQTLDMSQSMVGLSGDLASFYNLDHEEAFAKIRSGISGETEPLKQLGINMSVANLEAYALAEGISKPYSQMSQSEQTMLRYNYLMSVTSDQQGDFSKTSDSFANKLKILQLKFTNLATEIGEKLLPVAEKIIDWVSDNIDKLPIYAGILGGLLVTIKGFFIITKIKQAMDLWTKATTLQTAAQKGLNFAFLSSPITWVIGGIMLLIGAIALLWNKSETFRNDVLALWDTIKAKFQWFNDFLTNVFSIDWSTMFGSFGEVMNAFFQNAENVWESVKRVFGGIIDFISGVFSGDWDRAWQGVKDIFGGIMDGLGAALKAPLNIVIGLINGAIQGINEAISFEIPDWIPGLGGKGWQSNIPKINYLYNGGIVTTPTLMGGNTVVGDSYKGQGNQAEAVIPLDKLISWIQGLINRPIILQTSEGRELMRFLAPYQDELESYNNKFVY